jgi:hypothetical protein
MALQSVWDVTQPIWPNYNFKRYLAQALPESIKKKAIRSATGQICIVSGKSFDDEQADRVKDLSKDHAFRWSLVQNPDDEYVIISVAKPANFLDTTAYYELELFYVSDQQPDAMKLLRDTVLLFYLNTKTSVPKSNMFFYLPSTLKASFENDPLFQVLPEEQGRNCVVIPPVKPYALIRLRDEDYRTLGADLDLTAIASLFNSAEVDTSELLNITKEDPAHLKRVIKDLAVRGVKKIVIYYAGHGEKAEGSQFPELNFSQSDVRMSQYDILALLQENSISNAIVIWDCCNVFEALTTREKKNEVTSIENPPVEGIWDFTGLLFISSSRPGQRAIGCPGYGGFFTQALVAVLRTLNGDWTRAYTLVCAYLAELAPLRVEMTPCQFNMGFIFGNPFFLASSTAETEPIFVNQLSTFLKNFSREIESPDQNSSLRDFVPRVADAMHSFLISKAPIKP